jgi:hypothetical protein
MESSTLNLQVAKVRKSYLDWGGGSGGHRIEHKAIVTHYQTNSDIHYKL